MHNCISATCVRAAHLLIHRQRDSPSGHQLAIGAVTRAVQWHALMCSVAKTSVQGCYMAPHTSKFDSTISSAGLSTQADPRAASLPPSLLSASSCWLHSSFLDAGPPTAWPVACPSWRRSLSCSASSLSEGAGLGWAGGWFGVGMGMVAYLTETRSGAQGQVLAAALGSQARCTRTPIHPPKCTPAHTTNMH